MQDDPAIDAMLAALMREETVHWPTDAAPSIERIWQRIEFHGVAFAIHLGAELLAGWPAEICKKIAEEARLIALWEETHRDCLMELLDTLNRSDVDTVVMKGTALAYSCYDDPATRRRGDTDLLIRPAARKKARTVLRACGWERRAVPHGLFFQETWLYDTGTGFVHELDLHWQVNDKPLLQTVLPLNECFDGAQPLATLASARPKASFMLLQAALNQAWHRTRGYSVNDERVKGSNRLIWSLDYHLLTCSFSEEEWSAFLALCQDRNLGPVMHDALAAAQRDLASPIPDWVLDRLAEEPSDPTLVRHLAEPNLIEEFKADLRATPGLIGKFRLLLANAFPNRRHLLEKYPELDRWPTFALHARRFMETTGRLRGGGKKT